MDKPTEIYINTRGCSEPLDAKTVEAIAALAQAAYAQAKAKQEACVHDRLNEDGFCRSCGADCRGIH